MKFEDICWLKSGDAIIKFSKKSWFGLGKRKLYFVRGSGTVWHDYFGKRQSTNIEIVLCDWWTREKWNLEDAS